MVSRTEISRLTGVRLHPGRHPWNASGNPGEGRLRGHPGFRETGTADQLAALHVGALRRPYGDR